MNLSDIPISELRVGQVVRRIDDPCLDKPILAIVIQISLEVIGHEINRDTFRGTNYANQRYSTVCLLFENGNVRQQFKSVFRNFEVLENGIFHNWDALLFNEIEWDNYRNLKTLKR